MLKLLEKTYENYKNLNIEEFINNTLKSKDKKLIVTSNPETYINSLSNQELYKTLLKENTLIIPDSIGSVYGIKKVLKQDIKKYPGVELFIKILEIGNKQKSNIYLYGSKEKTSKDMNDLILRNYKNLKIIGRTNGYDKSFKEVEKDIIEKSPDIIAVALGIPKQEIFLSELSDKIEKGLMIGVGGSFDAITGNVKRAPKVFQKLNIEWLYRIIKEPKRIKRFFKYNVKFVLKIRKVKKYDK